MAAVIAYTLPAMQLVCHLVASGSSGSNFTEPAATTQSPPQLETTSLPEGYVAYPVFGFAYKYHSDVLSWAQARNVCIREGAQLAVLDSARKVEFLGRQEPFGYVHAGILRVDDKWINVNTGGIMRSLPWQRGFPVEGRACVQFNTGNGLVNRNCNDLQDFFCQLPILPMLG